MGEQTRDEPPNILETIGRAPNPRERGQAVFGRSVPPVSQPLSTTGQRMTSNEDPNDIAHFLRAIGKVRRLEHDRADVRPPAPTARALKRREDEVAVLRDLLSDPVNATDLQPGDELRFVRPGVSRRVFRNLKRGQYRVQEELDLHGLFAGEARRTVAAFLGEARAAGHLCVRVVHGKGPAVPTAGTGAEGAAGSLAAAARRRPRVLLGALPADGGTGAVYVLLRRAGERKP
jgi:DNA-nicking Smr family endonuclease